jgi:electron transfer flavoprotein alpha subunit
MERILFLTHTDRDGLLPKPTFEALRAVKQVSERFAKGHFAIGIIGKDVQKAANRLAGCGAERIWGAFGPEFEHSRYSTDAAAAEAICIKAETSILVAPETPRLSRIMPGVAHRLGGRIDTHITNVGVVDGVFKIERWCCRQCTEVRTHRTDRPWVLTIDSGSMKPIKVKSGVTKVDPVSVAIPEVCTRTKMIGIEEPVEDDQTIRPEANLLFVAGAGWAKSKADGEGRAKRAERIILEFLRRSQASLGCSKSLVDMSNRGQASFSFLTSMNQVGLSGSTPRHDKGLATCCRGEEPHVVGWRFINDRRAISLDANCGWALGKADVLYVADAFEVMAKVNEILEKDSKVFHSEDSLNHAPSRECLANTSVMERRYDGSVPVAM